MIALIVSCVDSRLDFNPKSGKAFNAKPSTVNADSELAIDSLTSGAGSTFLAGDCFIIEMQVIDDYEDRKPGQWAPFPYPVIETCDFTPAAQCLRVSEYAVKILLTESGLELKGTFGKMKNPFSSVSLGVEKIKYYDKCILTTEKESSNSIKDMKFSPAFIEEMDFTVSKSVVGASGEDSVARFKFKPASALPEEGGSFLLTFPPWY